MELRNKFNQLKSNPGEVLILGFSLFILIGATLLNLPFASADGQSIGFIDALFTSASAVCVTGLVVVNTAAHWSLFGKIVILVLIQIGGLGLMTMATLGAIILGKKITLKDRLIMQEEFNSISIAGIVRLSRYIVFSTLAIEAIGAVILSIRFIPDYGLLKGIWFSIFHAISAFCNAGFDITGESMVPYANSFIVNFAISALVILGGLGYSVYLDITEKRKFKRFSLHTKLVLVISGVLLLGGFILVFLLEYSNPDTLGKLPFTGKILAAFFQSMVPRTAGFNSVDTGALTNATTFLVIIFMFIGGSPGSTAGGVKTTTIGAIILGIASEVTGHSDVDVYKKRIPVEIVFRSLAVIGIGLGIVVIMTMVLSITESGPNVSFLDVIFEVVSAFGTVGLSRGLTPELTIGGRLVIIITMFIGRVGPLTMAFAFAKKRREQKGKFRYPEEKIIVG